MRPRNPSGGGGPGRRRAVRDGDAVPAGSRTTNDGDSRPPANGPPGHPAADSVVVSGSGPSLLWFRQDLRLSDNPALAAALERGRPLLCVCILDDEGEGEWAMGGASRWWLHHSLSALAADLAELGQRLHLARGPAAEVLVELVRTYGVEAVFWNRRYEPAAIARDTRIKTMLREAGIQAVSFPGSVLFEPWTHATKAGEPYRVFTPFWNQLVRRDDPAPPLPRPQGLPPLPQPRRRDGEPTLDDLGLLPRIPWDAGFTPVWTPGETGAWARLSAFGGDAVVGYPEQRDLPGGNGTSRLSPHLHWGEISPRSVWSELRARQRGRRGREQEAMTAFLRQIVWREFAHHLLFHFPRTTSEPLRPDFARFPWREDPAALRAWQRGVTGYPLVDAGVRELWNTGWMHNRVRMVVGSFLVKHLLLHWSHGARWFWDTLVDADLANNTLGWQWIAGCGADAAPYFRIFHPVRQGEKFDGAGTYVRRWVPELAALPDEHLQAPWDAPAGVLRDAGVELGQTYPLPIVDHDFARRRALDAYAMMKSRAG